MYSTASAKLTDAPHRTGLIPGTVNRQLDAVAAAARTAGWKVYGGKGKPETVDDATVPTHGGLRTYSGRRLTLHRTGPQSEPGVAIAPDTSLDFTGFLRGCPGLQAGEESDSCGAGQG
ncbi:hypothetical protein ABT124_51295 [Streptomyces sp. NPDC001982]|uniref:hypothetical protein n=1 Tax=Streptomyces sp. NPDC001982 TaxID=3154405 RepID=UPI003324AA46